MANQVVKVRREAIAKCMTCSLCNNLFRDATTIIECLHTFCRKCIYEKIEEEEIENCPICNMDLGSVPLEKLRPDHSLQDVRTKIFPFRRRKVKAPEVVAPIVLPAKRKERSLSSLVVNGPKVSTQSNLTGRRTKPVSRKSTAFRGPSFSIAKPVKKEEYSGENDYESRSSAETLTKVAREKGQKLSSAGPSRPTKEENGGESRDAKLDLWKPLNCLVEVANRTKLYKSSSQGFESKLEPTHVASNEAGLSKPKFKGDKCKSKLENEKLSKDPTGSETVTPKKLRRVRRKRPAIFGNSSISPQTLLQAGGGTQERRFGPVWFSLIASEEQEGNSPLPQIPASYLRIKDGNMPVSFIQKYLMKKLDLASEAEVEIKCMGQAVVPTLQLHNLVESWLETTAKSRVAAPVGSSAKDFVMVLAYARKKDSPQ